jgi:HK97 family phage portal protein
VQTRAITEFAIIDGQPVFGDGGGPSTYRGGMTIPGAWRASLLLSDLLGSVPWHAYRERVGQVERLEPAPPLLEQPAPPDTRMTTFSSWALDLIWHGSAVGIVAARNAEGWPTAALPVPARMVGVRRVGPGSLSGLPVGTLEYQVGTQTYGPDDVIHIKGPCEPGALRGLGVLEAHLNETLALAKEQMRQARSISQHGVPTGVLKSTNPQESIQDMKETKAAWVASQRDRTIALLNATTEFQPLSWNPEEMQLVEARRYSLTDLELIFGLPVGWLGGMNSARQYSNIEQDAVNLIKFTLRGHLARFEQALSLHFPRGTRVKANLDELLRSDTLTRYQAHAIALDKKFLTADEVRELEDRPPLPEPPPRSEDPGTSPEEMQGGTAA